MKSTEIKMRNRGQLLALSIRYKRTLDAQISSQKAALIGLNDFHHHQNALTSYSVLTSIQCLVNTIVDAENNESFLSHGDLPIIKEANPSYKYVIDYCFFPDDEESYQALLEYKNYLKNILQLLSTEAPLSIKEQLSETTESSLRRIIELAEKRLDFYALTRVLRLTPTETSHAILSYWHFITKFYEEYLKSKNSQVIFFDVFFTEIVFFLKCLLSIIKSLEISAQNQFFLSAIVGKESRELLVVYKHLLINYAVFLQEIQYNIDDIAETLTAPPQPQQASTKKSVLFWSPLNSHYNPIPLLDSGTQMSLEQLVTIARDYAQPT